MLSLSIQCEVMFLCWYSSVLLKLQWRFFSEYFTAAFLATYGALCSKLPHQSCSLKPCCPPLTNKCGYLYLKTQWTEKKLIIIEVASTDSKRNITQFGCNKKHFYLLLYLSGHHSNLVNRCNKCETSWEPWHAVLITKTCISGCIMFLLTHNRCFRWIFD